MMTITTFIGINIKQLHWRPWPKRPIHSIGCVTPPHMSRRGSLTSRGVPVWTNGWFDVVCLVLKPYQTILNMTITLLNHPFLGQVDFAKRFRD